MNTYLVDYVGNSYELPILLEWKFSYGCALPCDAFEITFIYDKSMLSALTNSKRFRAEHAGETVFLGVVDDFEVSVSEYGCIGTVNGRGLAALLLDNEAEAAQYYSASLDTILERYVYPWGITKVDKILSIPQQALVVESGTSMWRVLENFVWFGCGVKPHFSKDGVLLLGEKAGNRFVVDSNTAVTKQTLKRKRYGVISEVLVKNKVLGTSKTVANAVFAQMGGSCRRVVNVPRKTRYDAMRATGEYQIAQSKADELSISLTVPQIFAVFPGDCIELRDSPLGLSGEFYVSRTGCFADGDKAGTEIILTKGEK